MIKAYLVVCESCGVYRAALMREMEWMKPTPGDCYISVYGNLMHCCKDDNTAPMLIDLRTGN